MSNKIKYASVMIGEVWEKGDHSRTYLKAADGEPLNFLNYLLGQAEKNGYELNRNYNYGYNYTDEVERLELDALSILIKSLGTDFYYDNNLGKIVLPECAEKSLLAFNGKTGREMIEEVLIIHVITRVPEFEAMFSALEANGAKSYNSRLKKYKSLDDVQWFIEKERS